ncbi:MAG: hypothetical protein EA397_05695 [Deltaproteobacteria bacterium]|nr:MAG: hypothetical protein EA397_05695 [Deltaproteobacteria bacterium]
MRLSLLSLISLAACAPEARDALDRTPYEAPCDETDPLRCHLPWPSNAFATADASTATGLRLRVDPDGLVAPDRLDCLNLADGFSRATGVAVGLRGPLDLEQLSDDPAHALSPDAAVQVLNIQADHPAYGERQPYRTEARSVGDPDSQQSVVIGRPARALAPNADHALIALDTLGEDVEIPRAVRVALGLREPSSPRERELQANFVPVVDALLDADVELDRVARVSWFTTRSRDDTTRRMHRMMQVLDGSLGDLDIQIDTVTPLAAPEVEHIIRGRLTGAPGFLDEMGRLVLDDDGLPQVVGQEDIEFRLTVPAGDGPFRVALYGHGTGGNVSDNEFDRELAGENIAKLNLRFTGWTGDDFVQTLIGFSTFMEGSERSTAGLMQALAGGSVLATSLDGLLGDTIAADTLLGEPNPAAGRRAMTEDIAWLGGSMGGTMGAVLVAADERLRLAVLNVPGAGWSHMIPYSLLYDVGMSGVLESTYGSDLDVHHALVMGQGCWDDVDGAVWADEALETGGAFLMQQSMGDPVLPNLGTELLAGSLRATQLAPVLSPLHGLSTTEEVVSEGAAITQFRVPNTGQYAVHGFAARNTPAGAAAIGQITRFLSTAWAGHPEMAHPEGCSVTPDGSCDFTGMWD